MKFWKNLISGSPLTTLERRERRCGSSSRGGNTESPSSVPTQRRRRSSSSRGSTGSLSEDSCGTTFVELIKRSGTHLGVIVTGGKDTGLRPRIADLVPGSWAQRSDVLCVGDLILGLNGLDCGGMTQHEIVHTLDTADKVQLEVRYRLPSSGPSNKTRTKVIQATLKKENGTFGVVIRGGNHELPVRSRPFAVVQVDRGGPAAKDGTLRPGDRISALNGKNLVNVKLPELQALLYQQDQEAVFTVEYDIAKNVHSEHGAILVEIFREQGDLLGLGLSRCHDTRAVIIESMKQASLADRCGALHVGDILLSVGGQPLTRLTVDQVTDLIRDLGGTCVQLEVLPGAYARNRSSMRASLPSPCFSTMHRKFRGGKGGGIHGLQGGHMQAGTLQSHSSLLELRGLPPVGQVVQGGCRQQRLDKEQRRKFVSFTVELDRTGGPIGITLATAGEGDTVDGGTDKSNRSSGKSDQASRPCNPPILISSMTAGGLAQRTKAILVGDELVEVNGVDVKGRTLSDAIPLLQNTGSIVKLKLTRVVTIPERDFQRAPSFRLPPRPTPSPIYAPVNPLPLPSSPIYGTIQRSPPSSPIYAPLSQSTIPPPVSPLVSGSYPANGFSSGFRSPSLSTSSPARPRPHHRQTRLGDSEGDGGLEDLPTITLLPQSGPKGCEGPLPQEVNKVTLFKDPVYEDFGFSVSDGLYERGIFVNRVRKGGPADVTGLLKAFDRILQINHTRTTEFDCCLAVPLIAAAGDKIELLVTRAFPDQEIELVDDMVGQLGQVGQVGQLGQVGELWGQQVGAGNNSEAGDTVESSSSTVPWIDETDQESTVS